MTRSILSVARLGTRWETIDPFLVCAHHLDHYPPGNADLGPCEPPSADVGAGQPWRMYLGQKVPGFPAHPHRGFEAITIVRQGVVDHSDSRGATARYGAGDVQWLTAGHGVVHAEMFPLLDPLKPNTLELFQIWLNLPARDKMAEPSFKMFWAEDIPRHVEAGVDVTCIVGTLHGVDMQEPPSPPSRSWASDPSSDLAVWTLKMAPGARWQLPAASGNGTRRQLLFFKGAMLTIDGECVDARSAIEVDCSALVELVNGSTEAEVLLLQGRPIAEPIVQHGPFVMTTLDEIRRAYADYRDTRFGERSWGATDPNHGSMRGRFASSNDSRGPASRGLQHGESTGRWDKPAAIQHRIRSPVEHH